MNRGCCPIAALSLAKIRRPNWSFWAFEDLRCHSMRTCFWAYISHEHPRLLRADAKTISQRLTHGRGRWLSEFVRPLIRAKGRSKYASNFWTHFHFPLLPLWGCSLMAELSGVEFSRPCAVKSFLCLHNPPFPYPHLFIWFVGKNQPRLLKHPLTPPSILPSLTSLSVSAFILLPPCVSGTKGAHSL